MEESTIMMILSILTLLFLAMPLLLESLFGFDEL